MVKEFLKVNESELRVKLNVKFKDIIFLDSEWCCSGNDENDGIDISLNKDKIVEDIYNIRREIEIGDRIIYYNDYRK
jgi:hypothetical protein